MSVSFHGVSNNAIKGHILCLLGDNMIITGGMMHDEFISAMYWTVQYNAEGFPDLTDAEWFDWDDMFLMGGEL